MIFDHISNLETYRNDPTLYKALCFLAKLAVRPEGRVELDGDNLFANPVDLTTKPVEECLFEAHRRYADVHFIYAGVEGISVRSVDKLTPKGPFDPEKDIGFYEGEPDGTLYLTPGYFMVCFPQDAHRVAMAQDKPAPVEKMVVKIHMNGQ